MLLVREETRLKALYMVQDSMYVAISRRVPLLCRVVLPGYE